MEKASDGEQPASRISAGDVSVLGRATQGVKIMKFDDETKLVALAKVINEDEEIEKQEAEEEQGEASEAAGEEDQQVEIQLYDPDNK